VEEGEGRENVKEYEGGVEGGKKRRLKNGGAWVEGVGGKSE